MGSEANEVWIAVGHTVGADKTAELALEKSVQKRVESGILPCGRELHPSVNALRGEELH